MPDREKLRALDKETLIDMLEDGAKNWLAHDGLWFQAVEKKFGMANALELDAQAWSDFTGIEARRIMQRHSIPAGGGLAALELALSFRLYARINEQSFFFINTTTALLEMNTCRVQSARRRKGLPDFPCKDVGLVEYAGFAHIIDARIRTRCEVCPPDIHPEEFFCAWEFSLDENEKLATLN
jgi:hypothetical protein